MPIYIYCIYASMCVWKSAKKTVSHKECHISLSLILDLLLVEINECESSPCVNEATCNDAVNGYECQCLRGFIGIHCERGIVERQSFLEFCFFLYDLEILLIPISS